MRLNVFLCKVCGDFVVSEAEDEQSCRCGNITVSNNKLVEDKDQDTFIKISDLDEVSA